jgi:hypothetical protein
MTTLRRYYSGYHDDTDEFDSSLSISVVLIIMSIIIGLGFTYGFADTRPINTRSSGGNFNTIEIESPSSYPEPGSLAY